MYKGEAINNALFVLLFITVDYNVFLVNTKTGDEDKLPVDATHYSYNDNRFPEDCTDIRIEGLPKDRATALKEGMLLANYMLGGIKPVDFNMNGNVVTIHMDMFETFANVHLDSVYKKSTKYTYEENHQYDDCYEKFTHDYDKSHMSPEKERQFELEDELMGYDADRRYKEWTDGGRDNSTMRKDDRFFQHQMDKAKEYGRYIDDEGRIRSYKQNHKKQYDYDDPFGYMEREERNGNLISRTTNRYNY